MGFVAFGRRNGGKGKRDRDKRDWWDKHSGSKVSFSFSFSF